MNYIIHNNYSWRILNVKNKQWLVIIGISLFFIIYNILTASHGLLPWVDEVAFGDTSSNFALNGTWSTTAWSQNGGQSPFSTYPPLYQILLACWTKIFGFSLTSCRSINYFFAALLLISIFVFINKFYKINKISTVIFFSILYWCLGSFSQIYREGRPDVLNALISLWIIIEGINYVLYKSKNNIIKIIILSALLLLSAIQTLPFILGILIFVWLYYRKNRTLIGKVLLYFLLGTLIGLFLLLTFMFLNKHLFAFIVATILCSSTLESLCVQLLPYVGKPLGLNVDECIAKATEVCAPYSSHSFFEKISSIFITNPEYSILLIIVLIGGLLVYKKTNMGINILKPLFIVSIFIPLFMVIAGRFQSYYYWMCILPILICFAITYDMSKKYISYLFMIVVIVLSYQGLIKKTFTKDDSYSNLQKFVTSLPIRKSDKVIAPFSTYYDIKCKSDSCFFIQIYPSKLIKSPDYIIIDKKSFAVVKLNLFLNNIKKDTTKIVKLINRCDNPYLAVYSIKKK